MNRRDVLNGFVLTSTGVLAQTAGSVLAGSGPAPGLSTSFASSPTDNVNNTPQVQTALDALHKAGGATLFIPSGHYRIRELRLREGVHLIGLGRVVFKLFDPGTDGYMARIIGQSAVHVENIQFDCTVEAGRENTVGCIEIAAEGTVPSTDISFSNCQFLNAQNNAWLLLRGVERARIDNCRFLDHLRETEGATHGLSISEGSNSIRIADCVFDHPSGYQSRTVSKAHIGIDRATNIWIDRCIIRRAVRNGITIEDNLESMIQTVKLQDCIISECGNSGLQIEGNGLLDLSVRGCDFKNNAAFGIRLASGKSFSGCIDGCTFSDNATVPDTTFGHSQLQLNIKSGQIVNVTNCLFRTSSKVTGFVHLYYLNGEASVAGCSFSGGVNGFGIYAPVDFEKQLQRTTASFKDLRFINVGTPTFRLPQFFGNDWQYGGNQPSIVESTTTKIVQSNSAAQICDIWAAVHDHSDRGAMLVFLDLLLIGKEFTGGGRFQFSVERGAAETAIGPVTQTAIWPDKALGANHILSITLSPTDVVEEGARRTRLSIRVDTRSSRENLAVTATASIKVLWNGFRSAPVLI